MKDFPPKVGRASAFSEFIDFLQSHFLLESFFLYSLLAFFSSRGSAFGLCVGVSVDFLGGRGLPLLLPPLTDHVLHQMFPAPFWRKALP